jgi:RHS repeat-associated protein
VKQVATARFLCRGFVPDSIPAKIPLLAYHRYANLTGITVTQCTAPALSLSVNSANNRVTNTGYAYDAAGNVTNDGTFSYTWNAEGRMVAAAGVTYTYDGDGKRVKKDNGKLYWYGPGGEVLVESDLSGNITSEYIYFGGTRIARKDPSSSNVYYYLGDHLGSARVMVSVTLTGTVNGVVSESDYYPYGGERVISNTLTPANNYKFTGHERDAESGLDHTLYRQYSSNTGRWTSPDVVRGNAESPQGWDRYTYVGGNSTNDTDPDGNCDPNDQACFTATVTAVAPSDVSLFGSILDLLTGHRGPKAPNADKLIPVQRNACTEGLGGIGISLGVNADVGGGPPAPAGATALGSVLVGLFYGKVGASAGIADSGGATAFAGKHIVGAPCQDPTTITSAGAYVGGGFSVTLTNGSSVSALSGGFQTLTVSVGLGAVNFGYQVSESENGTYAVSVQPPFVSAGIGFEFSVIKTNTITSNTGCTQ